MSIRTKSIHVPAESADGMRVLVTRFYPRGVARTRFDMWERGLAPSAGLLRAYRDRDIPWEEFTARFDGEIRASPAAMDALARIRGMINDGGRTVTLLCHEPDGAPCHRHLLAGMITGSDVDFSDGRRG